MTPPKEHVGFESEQRSRLGPLKHIEVVQLEVPAADLNATQGPLNEAQVVIPRQAFLESTIMAIVDDSKAEYSEPNF